MPGRYGANKLPHRIVKCWADVGMVSSGIGERRPAEVVRGADKDGRCSWEAAAVPPLSRGIDSPSFGIAGVGCGTRSHDSDRLRFEKALAIRKSIHMHGKIDEISSSRDPAAVRIHAPDVHIVGIFIFLTVVDDLAGSTLSLGVASDRHVVCAARPKNGFAHVSRIGLAGYLFDDAAQETVAEIRICVMGRGRKAHRLMFERPMNEFRMIHLRIEEHGVVFIVLPASASVRKKMLDSDLAAESGRLRGAEFFTQNGTRAEYAIGDVQFAGFLQ